MDTTIRKWFGNHPPELIKFPKVDKNDYGLVDWIGVPTSRHYWDDPVIQAWLDLSFDNGYGSQGVPSFFAWTADKVYYVWEYDGCTSLQWVPRHPS